MTEEQNIYVELSIRGIRNGSTWQETIVKFPRQTEDSYTIMESSLADLMKTWGEMAQVARAGEKKRP